MSANNPPEPNLQLTPVQFGPPQSSDAVGVIKGSSSRPEYRFPLFVPLFIILATLNFSAYRDIVALNKRMASIAADDAPALDLLTKASKQAEFYDTLHSDLNKLALKDPAAAQIVKDYFPTPPSPAKPAEPAAPAKPPPAK
jgi:hypothetical protein